MKKLLTIVVLSLLFSCTNNYRVNDQGSKPSTIRYNHGSSVGAITWASTTNTKTSLYDKGFITEFQETGNTLESSINKSLERCEKWKLTQIDSNKINCYIYHRWKSPFFSNNPLDARINIFSDDQKIIYVGSSTKESGSQVAKSLCKKHFNSLKVNNIGNIQVNKELKKRNLLKYNKYEKYKCEKNLSNDLVENNNQNRLTKTKKVSNNTLNRTFNCTYPSGSSKIRIRGGTATELTSAGVEIKYYYVELTKKGAFSLEQSTKPGRVFFIGAQSFLGLGGAEFYKAVCR